MSNGQQNLQDITESHLELGLYEVTKLMKENLKELPAAYDILAKHIQFDKGDSLLERFSAKLSTNLKNKVLIFCGYEIELLDAIASKFGHVILVPNDTETDFERIEANYASHPSFKVNRPTAAANIVCPDTIIVVPIYPLEDGTILAYNYPSKLLTKDARSSSYCIIGMEMCSPLPMQYGYDFTGLTSILTPINPNYISHLSSYIL